MSIAATALAAAAVASLIEGGWRVWEYWHLGALHWDHIGKPESVRFIANAQLLGVAGAIPGIVAGALTGIIGQRVRVSGPVLGLLGSGIGVYLHYRPIYSKGCTPPSISL